MIWYDAKVARQVELYYLSKIFTSWKTAAMKEKKKNENMALSIYAKNLRKNYFYYMMEGIEKMRRERENVEMADYFAETTLLRRALEGWKEKTNREPKYISLTMTSKNTFYETKNNKWLQTKTVDFR